MSKTVLQGVEQIIGGCFLPFLDIAQSALAIAVLFAVLYVNSWVTLIPLILILFLYLLILFYGKDKAYRMGEKRTFYNTNRFKYLKSYFKESK